jgi:hypothetical protein
MSRISGRASVLTAALAAGLAIAGCARSPGQPAAGPVSHVATASTMPAIAMPAEHPRHARHPRATLHAVPAQVPCGTGLWRHVYHPDRLRLVRKCMTVRGRVTGLSWEPDGDLHILLATRPALVNSMNEHGDLLLEEICQGSVTQADAVAACQGVPHNLTVPSVGDRVTVSGSYVLDTSHGWTEIHPVTSLTVTGSAPVAPQTSAAAPPSSAPPPAPAGCHPTAPSGNCYEPGEYCPTADAGMTGVAGDGKTITCELISGRYHWRD